MRRALKWFGIVLGGLLGLLVLAVVGVYVVDGAKLSKTYAVQPSPVAIPTDQASVVRGQHLVVATTKCVDCHGQNLSGGLFLDAGPVGVVYAPNLTRGKGSATAAYTDADWDRAIRHGVRPDGRGLLIMPSDEYHALSDADFGAIVAYVKSVPPVDNEVPKTEIRLLGHILTPDRPVAVDLGRAHRPRRRSSGRAAGRPDRRLRRLPGPDRRLRRLSRPRPLRRSRARHAAGTPAGLQPDPRRRDAGLD